MTDSGKFHPAITVNNIKNFVPIVLDMDNRKYVQWAELFKIHYRAFNVIDHIIPKTPETTNTSYSSSTITTPPKSNQTTEEWNRIDSIVLQLMYDTITAVLLGAILKPDTTAEQAWKRLQSIFQDNQNTRAVHLHHKFSNTRLDQFPNVSAYCNEIKLIADQLASVGPAL
ncbi:uncharacterized protein [Rutidosis leptorrhynchoides]|uniref:uncharacterized protein n=1 Tax=Rutidosis leptorrhynchoides TaxID=125765 RepID=UPI003A9A48AA